MHPKSIFAPILLLLLSSFQALAQEYDGFKGRGVYTQYDKTYINPEIRGKHGVSLGFGVASVSPLNTFDPQWGVHVGYNYILMEKRKRIFGIKEVWRDEVKMGFGSHFYHWQNGEWYFNINYLNPLFALRGKLLGFYFFSEYGIGIHRAPEKLEEPSKVRFNVSIEALRIRFGKSPLHLHFTAHYDAGSALLSKERMDLAFSTTLRYYIYKRYKNKKRK